MEKIIDIELTPEQYHIEKELFSAVSRKMGISMSEINHIEVVRRSLDSRSRHVKYHATLKVFTHNDQFQEEVFESPYKDCSKSQPVLIVGAGPAGLFAALRALEIGLKPVIFERGKSVEDRKYDIAKITREYLVNPDSNWCFGEGGAGTYSDGKLYTRSSKRGDIGYILKKFVEHGADKKILIDAHAHIGTDRLSDIIANIRKTILQFGGEYHFSTRIVDFIIHDGRVDGVVDHEGNNYTGVGVVLATGHSARDIYELFHRKGWAIEAKPFALGVRVEHPQSLINEIQYHGPHYSQYLPPATYALTSQVDGHGVFSFCMCPGGIIVPAATDKNQQVVNGMSNSRRNSQWANAGIAVTISPEDVPQYSKWGNLALLKFQMDVEKMAFEHSNSLDAPTQRLYDFCNNRVSTTFNKSSYMGKCSSAAIHQILPSFVTRCLQQGFKEFDKKMHGFLTNQANILAVESRTSSPVRIPRGKDYQHLEVKMMFPCGEGAGYAGGIVSSAMDGVNVINSLSNLINSK